MKPIKTTTDVILDYINKIWLEMVSIKVLILFIDLKFENLEYDLLFFIFNQEYIWMLPHHPLKKNSLFQTLTDMKIWGKVWFHHLKKRKSYCEETHTEEAIKEKICVI